MSGAASELIRAAAFVGFLGLGIRVAVSRDPARRRPRVEALLVYVLGVQLLVGLTQRDAWPFSSYPIAAGLAGGQSLQARIEVRGIGADAREWAVHPASWSPLFPQTLQLWFERSFARLDVEDQRRALAFLWARAESARRRLAAGKRLGPARLLGPAAAPDWTLLDAVPAAVAPEPYVGLRLYRVSWRPADEFAGARREAVVLLAEYDRHE